MIEFLLANQITALYFKSTSPSLGGNNHEKASNMLFMLIECSVPMKWEVDRMPEVLNAS